MTELDIERLKAAALVATPGPWKKSNHANSPRVCAPETDDRLGIEIQIRGNGNRDDNRKNAAFIAAANPAAVLELIAEVERLRAMHGSAEPVAMKDAPARIFLVIEDGGDAYKSFADAKKQADMSGGIVWCEDRQSGSDVPYVRADLAAPPAPVSAEPVLCHQCGVPQSDNPHPDAGKPAQLLAVNVQSVCIPCLTLSRHQWARRAQIAESALSDDKLRQIGTETMRACETLPFGYQIIIELEEGHGGVKLIDPDGESQDVEGSDTFGGNIRDAIDIVLAESIAAKDGKHD